MAREETEIVRYTDLSGRSHRVVERGRLVLDLCRGEPTRVVSELSEAEGTEHARAVLFGSAIDEGYVARAEREPEPLCRNVRPEDLRWPWEAEAESGPDGDDAGGEAMAA